MAIGPVHHGSDRDPAIEFSSGETVRNAYFFRPFPCQAFLRGFTGIRGRFWDAEERRPAGPSTAKSKTRRNWPAGYRLAKMWLLLKLRRHVLARQLLKRYFR